MEGEEGGRKKFKGSLLSQTYIYEICSLHTHFKKLKILKGNKNEHYFLRENKKHIYLSLFPILKSHFLDFFLLLSSLYIVY